MPAFGGPVASEGPPMFEHPNATLVNHLYDAFDAKDSQKLAELSGGTFRAELVDILASDMHAVALASATGTRGDRTFEGSYLLLMRIENGRIIEARLFNDDPAAFEKFWA